MSLSDANVLEGSLQEQRRIVAFLRKSADRIFGQGIYSGKDEYDHVAVYWMNEALELAANAIEEGEHLERSN
jgi:hypothetical protein